MKEKKYRYQYRKQDRIVGITNQAFDPFSKEIFIIKKDDSMDNKKLDAIKNLIEFNKKIISTENLTVEVCKSVFEMNSLVLALIVENIELYDK